MCNYPDNKLIVWYVAAGYKLPAGIEAYLLHYATEIRNQGFDPKIIVFEPLPKVPHRFLIALRERGIPIESLYERVSYMVHVACLASYVPWRVRKAVKNTLTLALSPEGRGNGVSSSPFRGEDRGEGYSSLLTFWSKRLAVRELKRMIDREKPDIIHVKGRIICEVFPVLPSDRTIYQHTLMGTRDPSWEDNEAEAFSVFLNRIARVLVQGKRIAETFAKSFNINRPIDVVYTMAPDEAHALHQTTGDGLRTTDGGLQTPAGNTPHLNPLPQGERKDGNQEIGASAPSPLRGEGWGEGGHLRDYSSKSTVCGQMSVVSSLRFGILARFTEQKGIAYILEALRMYKERHGAVNFTLAGQGPLEGVIGEFVKREGLGVGGDVGCGMWDVRSKEYDVSQTSASSVRIVPVTSAVDILENLDVFVHPGLDDAMPVSIVEALMCGVPCIVSDVGASPELVRDGVEGLVIQPGSAEQICGAMERFAAMTGEELSGFHARARARYEKACRPKVVGVQVAGIYRGIAVRHDM